MPRIRCVLLKSSILPAGAAAAVAVIGLALGTSRGGATAASSSPVVTGTNVSLSIANYAFAPANLTVKAGKTITVHNGDSTAHTATASSGAFDSGTVRPGGSARFTLKKIGTYAYICQFHAFMAGKIEVVG